MHAQSDGRPREHAACSARQALRVSDGGVFMGTDAWVDQHPHIHSIGGPHPDRSLHPGVLWHRLRRRQPLSGIAWTLHASHPGQ